MKGILKHTGLLAIITIIAGLALGLVHEITAEPIAQAAEQQKQDGYRVIFADADDFEVLDYNAKKATKIAESTTAKTIDEVAQANKGDEAMGYIITVTDGNGYGGDIQFMVGINTDGQVTGLSFLSIAESPGLGMNARDDESFAKQYVGKDVEEFEVVKSAASSDEQIQAISGATITTKAVTGGVNAALAYYHQVLEGGAK